MLIPCRLSNLQDDVVNAMESERVKQLTMVEQQNRVCTAARVFVASTCFELCACLHECVLACSWCAPLRRRCCAEAFPFPRRSPTLAPRPLTRCVAGLSLLHADCTHSVDGYWLIDDVVPMAS